MSDRNTPFSFPEIISQRLGTYRLHLASFIDAVRSTPLLRRSGVPSKDVLIRVAQSLSREIEEKVQQIEATPNVRVKTEISKTAVMQIEAFLDYGEALLRRAQATQREEQDVGREVYYFVDSVVDSFPENRVTILLVTGRELVTYRLADRLGHQLTSFGSTSALLKGGHAKPHVWVIEAPVSLLRNPLNWPLIVHELGHVYEQEHIHAIDRAFTRAASTLENHSAELIRRQKEHAREYQCDFFAGLFCGPAFSRVLFMNHYTREVNLPGSHPDWPDRLRMLSTETLKQHAGAFLPQGFEIAGHNSNPPEGSDASGGAIRREDITALPEVLSLTARFIFERGKRDEHGVPQAAFSYRAFQDSAAKTAIESLVPYVPDSRYALNAALDPKVYAKARARLKANLRVGSNQDMPEESWAEKRVVDEFNRLLAESVRLAYISARHRRWAAKPGRQQKLRLDDDGEPHSIPITDMNAPPQVE